MHHGSAGFKEALCLNCGTGTSGDVEFLAGLQQEVAAGRRTEVTDTQMAVLSQAGNRSEVTRIAGFGSRWAARYQGTRQKQGQMGSRDQEPVIRNITESRSRVKESQVQQRASSRITAGFRVSGNN